jgi:hypothetical protein
VHGTGTPASSRASGPLSHWRKSDERRSAGALEGSRSITDAAAKAGRELTGLESARVEAILAEAEKFKADEVAATRAKVAALGSLPALAGDGSTDAAGGSKGSRGTFEAGDGV